MFLFVCKTDLRGLNLLFQEEQVEHQKHRDVSSYSISALAADIKPDLSLCFSHGEQSVHLKPNCEVEHVLSALPFKRRHLIG